MSNLDARLRLQTREEIKRIQRETSITTVFVTHDQEEAMSISDYIVVMKLGVVQQIGEPQNVYDDPVNLFVAKFLGTVYRRRRGIERRRRGRPRGFRGYSSGRIYIR